MKIGPKVIGWTAVACVAACAVGVGIAVLSGASAAVLLWLCAPDVLIPAVTIGGIVALWLWRRARAPRNIETWKAS